MTQLTDPIGSTDPVFPSEGGPPIQDAGARDIAIGIGVALVIVGGLMRLVRSRRPD